MVQKLHGRVLIWFRSYMVEYWGGSEVTWLSIDMVQWLHGRVLRWCSSYMVEYIEVVQQLYSYVLRWFSSYMVEYWYGSGVTCLGIVMVQTWFHYLTEHTSNHFTKKVVVTDVSVTWVYILEVDTRHIILHRVQLCILWWNGLYSFGYIVAMWRCLNLYYCCLENN